MQELSNNTECPSKIVYLMLKFTNRICCSCCKRSELSPGFSVSSRHHVGSRKRIFLSPGWSMCSGAFGMGKTEQAVELPVLVLLALPSAVVLLSTNNFCPVTRCTISFKDFNCC